MEKKLQKNMPYRLQFINSQRFKVNSLSNLVNLSEGIHRIKSKHRNDNENVKLEELTINIATIFLNTQSLEMI